MNKQNRQREEKRKVLQSKLKELKVINISLAETIENLKMAQLDGDFTENADWQLLNKKKEDLEKKIILFKEKIGKLVKSNNLNKVIVYLSLVTGEKKTIEL